MTIRLTWGYWLTFGLIESFAQATYKMKNLKMTCYFEQKECAVCFVVSFSRIPASAILCELTWSDGRRKQMWNETAVKRQAELRANLCICRDFGLFVLSDWRLVLYRLESVMKPEFDVKVVGMDITTELAKRCLQLCRGQTAIQFPYCMSPSTALPMLGICRKFSFNFL